VTLRIENYADRRKTVIRLSGRLQSTHLDEWWCPACRLRILPFLSKPLVASLTGQKSEIRASSTLIRGS